MADDIVQELHDWAYIVDESQGKATLVMLSGQVFAEAADEIKRLRTALALAVGEMSTSGEYAYLSPDVLMQKFLNEAHEESLRG